MFSNVRCHSLRWRLQGIGFQGRLPCGTVLTRCIPSATNGLTLQSVAGLRRMCGEGGRDSVESLFLLVLQSHLP